MREGNKNKRFSLFTLWFHPRRSLRIMRQQPLDAESLSVANDNLNKLNESLSSLQKENLQLRDEADNYRLRIRKYETSIEQLTREVVKLRKECDRIAALKEEINAGKEQLGAVNDKLVRSEARVRELRERLDIALRNNPSAAYCELEDPVEITFGGDAKSSPPQSDNTPSTSRQWKSENNNFGHRQSANSDEDNDWLQHIL